MHFRRVNEKGNDPLSCNLTLCPNDLDLDELDELNELAEFWKNVWRTNVSGSPNQWFVPRDTTTPG